MNFMSFMVKPVLIHSQTPPGNSSFFLTMKVMKNMKKNKKYTSGIFS